MNDDYRDRVAVVTGGARGFGRAFAQALAERGARVALIDLDGEAVESAAAELATATGAWCHGYQGDVTDEAGMDAIMARVAEGRQGIDLLINNAGLHSHEYSRPIEEMGLAKTRRLFDVNVMGTVTCTLAALPYMKRLSKEDGSPIASVINIASSAAYQGGAYGNSKLAVIGLTMTFARELAAHGIRVNAIAPGLILTDTIKAEMAPETLQRISAMQYLPQVGEEGDIVEALLFLASEKARFITGETLRVTGGFAAGP